MKVREEVASTFSKIRVEHDTKMEELTRACLEKEALSQELASQLGQRDAMLTENEEVLREKDR